MAASWFRRNSDSAANSTTTLINRGNGEDDRTAVTINVYDLLPPGKLSTVFWTLGVGLLHTGVAINDREYAFGGHDRRGVTGVYWMKPKVEPPGGTFRTGFIHAYTTRSPDEVHQILIETSQEFQGTSYNVLTRNCNHFTSYLCEKLTGKPAPAWINRAASIGVALPCVVPQAWVRPPECEEEDQLQVDDEWDDEFDDRFDLDDSDFEDGKVTGATSSASKSTATAKVRSRKSTDEGGMLLPESERAVLNRTVD
ncbi:hypothetical protein ABW19_dt0204544 [Dactylella cylindrospora]|nr:hypothetical protein ABW19_dt0204544 [Dactylella cylindrospora]